MKEITDFINSIYFIILVNLIAVVFWYLKLPLVTYIIYLVFVIIIILTNANRSAIGSLLLSGIIAYQIDEGDYLEFHALYAKIFIPLGIIVIILFTVDLIKRRKTFKLTPIFYGLLFLLIANILSFINVRGKEITFIATLGVLQLLGYLIIYAYLVNSNDIEGKKYISNVALVTATAVTVQFLIHYLTLGNVDSKHDNNLSWAISNTIAMFYFVLIPISLYNYFRNQKKFYIALISGINFFMMLFMLSRGNYLSTAVIAIPLVIMFIYLAKDKKRLFVDFLTIFCIGIVLAITLGAELGLIDLLKGYFDDIDFLDWSGRWNLFKKGWELFLEYPIFGAGSYTGAFYLVDYHVGTYHSYLIQTIATTGIVGLVSLVYFIYVVIKTSLIKDNYNLLFLISFIYILIHGLVDNTIYNPVIMVFIAVTMPYLDKQYENLEKLQVSDQMQV